MHTLLAKLKSLLKSARMALRYPEVARRFQKPKPRIIYAITPPPKLSNIGDQAQVVAIYSWFREYFPGHSVIELDKNEVVGLVDRFSPLIDDDDLIVLHSGGNMGDRGIWSETGRRLMIERFPRNKVVSLPQTIYFSNTDEGKKQLEISKRIYNAHSNLTVIGRDKQSLEYAETYFPNATTFATPDFVLSYPWSTGNGRASNGKILYCLRVDDESNIKKQDRLKMLETSTRDYDVFDTTITSPIDASSRKQVLDETLSMFSQYECVVTDRYHGLIFSVLTGRPTVVLPTVDHKLTSAFDWFDGVKFVRFSPTLGEVPAFIDEVLQEQDFSTPDWNSRFFAPMAKSVIEP